MRREQRSAEASKYRAWYSTKAWRSIREGQLAKEPLCQRCSTERRPVAADTVNHKVPHKGDRRLFFNRGNVESVCAPCHDGPIQREERLGFSPAVDAGGWPIDPRHRANR